MKLNRLGFRGAIADWFYSYLTDRKMYVDVDGCYSHVRTMNIGLPQGSVSSPYIFSLYVNDMCLSSSKLQFIHFADDTTVFMSGDNLGELCREVSEKLEKVNGWLNDNRLSLNVHKTSFMLLAHSSTDHIPINY